MDEIGKLLPALFKKQLRRAEPHLLEILIPLWPRIAGRSIAQHSQPVSFASGVLTLATDGATWGAQLQHMAEPICAKINGFMGQSVVRKLRIKTITQAGLFSVSQPQPGIAAPRPPISDDTVDTGSIADPEIAVTVADSYAKYFTRSRR